MVCVEREHKIESRHRGLIAVVNQAGDVLAHAGDQHSYIYARSTIKPIIALPLLVDEIAMHYQLTKEELSVACSSHSGQPEHVAAVRSILRKVDRDENELQCGIHDPWHKRSRSQLREHGKRSTEVHNNCSGKHASMLAWCSHMGVDSAGYLDAAHPVQKRVKEAVALLSGLNESDIPTGVDGCGVPVYYMPLEKLASTMARFGQPTGLPTEWQQACHQMTTAIQQYPFYLGGESRFETELMQVTQSRLIGKSGAEGVFVVSCPSEGWGLALKMEDGSDRGLFPAVMEALIQLDQFTKKELDLLSAFHQYELRNWAGQKVGQVYPSYKLEHGTL